MVRNGAWCRRMLRHAWRVALMACRHHATGSSCTDACGTDTQRVTSDFCHARCCRPHRVPCMYKCDTGLSTRDGVVCHHVGESGLGTALRCGKMIPIQVATGKQSLGPPAAEGASASRTGRTPGTAAPSACRSRSTLPSRPAKAGDTMRAKMQLDVVCNAQSRTSQV